jgi:hypothetical protein
MRQNEVEPWVRRIGRKLMDSKLFAFKMARQVEMACDIPLEFTYDPQTQTAVWSGNGTAIAGVHCTGNQLGHAHCNAYGNYCTTSGYGGQYTCDP